MRPQKLFCILALAFLALAPRTVAAEAAAVAELTYTKAFPRSDPEYMFVRVKETGEASVDIRRLDEPARPDSLILTRETTQRIFSLAAQLSFFRGRPDWEPKQRVAQMGRKTFVYQKGSERNEVTFNYSAIPEVQRLVELFEGVGRTWYYRERITRALIYDRLSLLEIVRQLEADFNRGSLAEPSLLVPVLQDLVRDSRVIHLVQTKAQHLLERISTGHATLSFSRVIHSNPGVYLALQIDDNGNATFEIRDFEATPAPRPLALPAALTGRLFELAERLDHFRTEPNPGLANSPEAPERTTLAYERGAERNQLTFTATTNPGLREIVSLAERILRQQWHRQNLEKNRGDPERLGPAVALLEQDIREGRLIAPAELAELLEAIAADARVPQGDQRRASDLAARLRK